MTDDLVKRLLEMCGDDGILAMRDIYDTDVAAAADRIEQLEKALDALLVEAEDVFVCMADATGIDRHQYPMPFQIARNALNRGTDNDQ